MAKYYYRDVLLPEIPSDLLAEYPYYWIRKNITSGYFDLFFSKVSFYLVDSSTISGVGVTKPWYRIEIATSGNSTEWVYYKDSTANLSIDSERLVFWSNHNIPNGSATSTNIYFHSTYLIPDVSEFNDNEIILPKIPTDVLLTHPYCVLFRMSNVYHLVFGKGNWYVQPSSDSKYTLSFQCSVNDDYQWYRCLSVDGVLDKEWNFYKVTTGWWGDPVIIWSNHDIPNGSATATNIYFYGSEPVPENKMALQIIDFNDSDWAIKRPEVFSVTDGTTPFFVDSTFLYDEKLTLRSGAISHNGVSETTITFSLVENGSIELNYTVSSEQKYDWLYIYVDNVEVVKQSGSVIWTVYRQALSVGNHTVKFKYTKDGSNNTNKDAGAIGYVKLIGVEPEYDKKYLVRNNGILYTILDGTLSQLPETILSSSLFRDYGIDDAPEWSAISSLINPEILYWIDNEDIVPSRTAHLTATPFFQTVITDKIDMSHSTIKGIESVTIDCDGTPLIAFSFDNKETWKAYDGTQWVSLTSDFSGMSKEIVEAIPIEQWAEIRGNSTEMFLRLVLTSAEQFVRQIYVDFLN